MPSSPPLSRFFLHSCSLYLACFVSGGLASLAMAPLYIWPMLCLSFSVLFLVLQRFEKKHAVFLAGYLFGFGYFLFGLYWIGNALLVEGNPYKWAWPLAVAGLPIMLSSFYGLACLCAHRLSNLKSAWGILYLAAWLSAFEWLRGHIFTGFPWNLGGYSWAQTLEIAQIASLGGIYLLTALTLFWAMLPAAVLYRQGRLPVLAIGILTIAASYGFGAWRLDAFPPTSRDDVRVVLVQANINQADKWDREKLYDHFLKHLELSTARTTLTKDSKTVIVWPETAIGQWFLEDSRMREEIAQVLRTYADEAVLVTGALRHDRTTGNYYNSVVDIGKNGDIGNIYDKNHLVPFGEYIPFQKWIPLTPVVQFTGFVPGKGPENKKLFSKLKYSPVVCYEVIFPGKVLAAETSAPDLIINVTNDAWYGKSAGPYQHFDIALFRAIEEGIPLVRAANTGVSGVIDPMGRVIAHSNLFTEDVLVADLPKPQKMPLKNHQYNFIILITFLLITALGYTLKRKI